MQLTRLLWLCLALGGSMVVGQGAWAQDHYWMTYARISPTSTLSAGRICYTDGVGIACDVNAPLLSGLGSGLGDRITSGTSSVFVANGSAVSVTVGGSNIANFGAGGLGITAINASGLLQSAGVSSSAGISGTTGYFSGNVGIGTPTPANKLSVYNPTGGVLGSYTAGDFGNSTISYANSSQTWWVGLRGDTSNIFSIADGTAQRLTIGSSGNVGIGTTAPAVSLSVIGEVQVSNSGVACGTTTKGSLRYNAPSTTLELCTGAAWQPMGVGVPAGTISAFASTTCPIGWSEYTAARGRFLRGIDNGAGNDPSGTRVPAAVQGDALQNMIGSFKVAGDSGGLDTASGVFRIINNPARFPATSTGSSAGVGYAQFDASLVARTATETRPKNVAVTYCQFNGTSNGWNSPLSGSGASALSGLSDVTFSGLSTGQVLTYNGSTWAVSYTHLTLPTSDLV